MSDVTRPPTTVRVDLKYVRNLGNYESLHVGIAVEDWVREGETVDSATERVYAFVEKKIIEKLTEEEKELKGRG